MNPVLYNTGLSNDPTVCDSVSVAFHAPEAPYALLFSSTGLLRTNGALALKVPAALFAQYTYLVIRTRNGVATWSKTPQRVSAVTMFDFTQ